MTKWDQTCDPSRSRVSNRSASAEYMWMQITEEKAKTRTSKKKMVSKAITKKRVATAVLFRNRSGLRWNEIYQFCFPVSNLNLQTLTTAVISGEFSRSVHQETEPRSRWTKLLSHNHSQPRIDLTTITVTNRSHNHHSYQPEKIVDGFYYDAHPYPVRTQRMRCVTSVTNASDKYISDAVPSTASKASEASEASKSSAIFWETSQSTYGHFTSTATRFQQPNNVL